MLGTQLKPRVFGGKKTRGSGYNRGGPEENSSVHLLRGKQANLAKFFVGIESLFVISRALCVAQPRLGRDAGQLSLWNTEEHRCTSLGHVFRHLAIHLDHLTPEA